jgi:hypothetical protein
LERHYACFWKYFSAPGALVGQAVSPAKIFSLGSGQGRRQSASSNPNVSMYAWNASLRSAMASLSVSPSPYAGMSGTRAVNPPNSASGISSTVNRAIQSLVLPTPELIGEQIAHYRILARLVGILVQSKREGARSAPIPSSLFAN